MDRFSTSRRVEAIRSRLDHPIIDGDGHHIEFMPLVYEIAAEIAGSDVAERIRRTREAFAREVPIAVGAGFPARNTLDRVSVTVPTLLYERMDEVGIDFGLMYPTFGLNVNGLRDDELRQVFARAMNIYAAEVFADCRDRLEPVATIPTSTPQEAVAELRYVVEHLGLKAVVMSGAIVRHTGRDGRDGPWIDTIGHSIHDYDPVWAACRDLGVAPTFHGRGDGWGSRTSPSNFVYNHVGHFAAGQEAACRSLVMGGAPRRFPEVRFSLLEGGVTWAAQLFADLLGHYEKRNKDVVSMFDPAEQDPVAREALWREFARGRLADLTSSLAVGFEDGAGSSMGRVRDDFADAGITDPQQIVDIFRRQFFFGCEADDPLNAVAFDSRLLPSGIALNAVFASDIGHFDVPDVRDVLCEAYEPVEDGSMTEDDFRRFACTNVLDMLTVGNPQFFAETVVAGYADARVRS